jgi:hypothetical protein
VLLRPFGPSPQNDYTWKRYKTTQSCGFGCGDDQLLSLEKENSAVAEIEVDEMLGFCVERLVTMGSVLTERSNEP